MARASRPTARILERVALAPAGRLAASLALGWVGAAAPLAAQPADTLIAAAEPLARFEEARALSLDPAGLVYVADAGRDALVKLTPAGHVMAVLGGPGTQSGQFDGPADVDPTNGLVLVVADAGNGRVERFSREFLHLGSYPVGPEPDDGLTPRRSALVTATRERTRRLGVGRPVGVATTPSGETFVLDEAEGVVYRWDATYRLDRIVGGYDAGRGVLADPVALALDRQSLYVADRGLASVVVYDLFGTYVRTLARDRLPDVVALTVDGDRLWVVLPDRLLVYHAGRLLRVLDVALGEPLVDVGHFRGTSYLLTRTRLYRTRL